MSTTTGLYVRTGSNNEWSWPPWPWLALTTTLDEARALGAMALFWRECIATSGALSRCATGQGSRRGCGGGHHFRSRRRSACCKIRPGDFERRDVAPDRGCHLAGGGAPAVGKHDRRAAPSAVRCALHPDAVGPKKRDKQKLRTKPKKKNKKEFAAEALAQAARAGEAAASRRVGAAEGGGPQESS